MIVIYPCGVTVRRILNPKEKTSQLRQSSTDCWMKERVRATGGVQGPLVCM